MDEEASFIGLVEEGGGDRVVVNIPPLLGEDMDEYTVSKALLRRVGRYTLHTNLVDATVYVFKRWVLELIENREVFTRSVACPTTLLS